MEEQKLKMQADIERWYRPYPALQIFFFTMVMLFISIFLYYIEQTIVIPLEIIITFWFGAASFFYPFFIKIRRRSAMILGWVLYGITLFGGVYLGYKYLSVSIERIREFVLFIAVVEVIGIELLHHIVSELKHYRSSKVIMADVILSIIFGVCMFIFFYGIPGVVSGILDLFWSIIVTIVLVILFAYAIFPERPF